MGGGHSTASSRILVLGIDGAGKTSFLNKYENQGGAEIDVQPTDGFIVKDVKVKGVKLNVWDVAGKEATRSLWKHYYEQGHTDAIIWVVDSADSDERLEESRNALQGALLDPHLQGVLLCVLANKNDAANARSAETLTNFFGLGGQKDLGRVAFLHSVSAKTGDGIKDAMEHLAKAVKESHSAKKDKE
jgi:small GTP-binding protein